MDPVSNACDELFENEANRASAPEGRFLVALSGGMDSVVLVHAVARAAAARGFLDRVIAVHVDHGLDPNSPSWAEFCEGQARSLGILFQARRIEVASDGSLEAAARSARYQIFESLLEAGDTLLLAHHAADQTESQLLHLFQGRGLYGMPVDRPLGAGHLRRPLLGLSRQVLAGYARSQGLEWIEDPSNTDTSLDRNYLRRRLLPELSERFPGLPQRLDQVAAGLTDSSAALDELAGLDRLPLPQSVFDGRSLPARIALLRRWLVRHAGAGGVSRSAITEFLSQLDAANDRHPSLDLPVGRLIRFRRALFLVPPAPRLLASYQIELPGRLDLPHGTLEVRLLLDERGEPAADGQLESEPPGPILLLPPVSVTFAAELPGVRLHCRGHDRGLRELMREAGLPPWQRDILPLVMDARGLALVPGVARRDEPSREERSPPGLILAEVRWSEAAS